jgi:hypothetical protein
MARIYHAYCAQCHNEVAPHEDYGYDRHGQLRCTECLDEDHEVDHYVQIARSVRADDASVTAW